MVSIIILIPDNALSISSCTRETSEFRSVCSSWSSDVSPCSPSIETEVDRATEDLTRSTSFSIRGDCLESFALTNCRFAFSTSGVSGRRFRDAEDLESFISFSCGFLVCFYPNRTIFVVGLTTFSLVVMWCVIAGKKSSQETLAAAWRSHRAHLAHSSLRIDELRDMN